MKKSAFSLLELSVSLVVVSLLMAMASQGIKLVSSSRLTTARSLTSKSPVPNISGLIAWYETSSTDSLKINEASDGKQISAWYDISPNSIPAKKNALTRVASVAVTYKSDGINKIPSISFNGSGRISVSSFYQGKSEQNTIFFVSSPYSLINAPTPVDSGNSFTATPISYLSNGIRIYAGTVADFATSGCCSTNSNYIVAAYLNRTSSKTYINDAKTMAGGTMRNPGISTMDGLTIGTDRVGSYPFTGLVSEVIVYNRPLQNQERKDVMGYLSKKYGILVTGL